jgi:hypothetical protein
MGSYRSIHLWRNIDSPSLPISLLLARDLKDRRLLKKGNICLDRYVISMPICTSVFYHSIFSLIPPSLLVLFLWRSRQVQTSNNYLIHLGNPWTLLSQDHLEFFREYIFQNNWSQLSEHEALHLSRSFLWSSSDCFSEDRKRLVQY